MEKRIFLKSARTKTVDSHNSIDSIGSIDCIDSIDSIESEDSTDSIDSIDFIDSIDSILVPHKRPPAFTPHTKGKRYYQWGLAPIGTIERPLCVARVEAIESKKSVESSDSIESIEPTIYSFGTRGFQTNTFFHFRKCHFNAFLYFWGYF